MKISSISIDSFIRIPHMRLNPAKPVVLVAGGRSHRSIAEELGVSLNTIEWHLQRARTKLA